MGGRNKKSYYRCEIEDSVGDELKDQIPLNMIALQILNRNQKMHIKDNFHHL